MLWSPKEPALGNSAASEADVCLFLSVLREGIRAHVSCTVGGWEAVELACRTSCTFFFWWRGQEAGGLDLARGPDPGEGGSADARVPRPLPVVPQSLAHAEGPPSFS